MQFTHLPRLLLAAGFLAVRVKADSYFFNNTDFSNQVAAISAGCSTALQASIACDPYLRYVMTTDYYGPVGNDTLQDNFCSSPCGTGLASYRSAVATACANDPEPVAGLPATYWADSATAAWNQMCLKDSSTGQYCVDVISNLFASSTDDTDGTQLPTSQLCSDCVVSLFRHMQGTSYSNYDESLASVWSSIQTTCQLSYPTAVPSLSTNVTTPGGFAAPGTGFTGLCISGNRYTVVSGDNCETIAESQNVATGTLIAINNLFPDCTNLNAAVSICLPPSCTTYKVNSGDTCSSIASSTSTTFQQLIAWNPALDSYCTNLLSGVNICVSPPGGQKSLTTIVGATVTQTDVYATTTVSRPSPVASGTTKDCGKYYQVQAGDFCQLVALNQTIALGLFEAINPEINTDCTNLQQGLFYCVRPTADWNTTASSTVVTAPTTTPSGTTADCYEYYTIQSGDYCGKVEDLFSITMAQLMFWNPDLHADCSNLDLGEAYCVNGVSQPPGAKVKRGDAEFPKVTQAAEGGVPYGWPALDQMRMKIGLKGKAL